MDALTPKTIDLTPLIPILWALSLCIMGTFLKHSILLIKVILGKIEFIELRNYKNCFNNINKNQD